MYNIFKKLKDHRSISKIDIGLVYFRYATHYIIKYIPIIRSLFFTKKNPLDIEYHLVWELRL